MKFRRLYWVTEQIDGDGRSEVAGVFTSIPDLVEEGLHWCEGIDKTNLFRITLVKLDSSKKPLGTWISPEFDGIAEGLEEFIATKEFESSECESLVEALNSFTKSNA